MDASKQTYYRLVRDDDMLFWLLQSVGWIGISLCFVIYAQVVGWTG